jgi:GTP pyrophosphokinase
MFKKYSEILSITKKNVKTQEKYIQKTFQNLLKELDIKGKVYSRTKSIYSIHKKITKKNLILSQVLDRIGIRFILKTEEDCYKVMSQISCRYYLFKNKIKDYISIPKPNQYQSLHITILFQSFPVEIQIRTQKMHHCAEYGSADHAGYKLTS